MQQPPQAVVALLEFERRIRSSGSNREIAFRAVNESSDALRFDQAVVWRLNAFGRPMLVAASGLADLGSDSPYRQWLGAMIRAAVPQPFDAPRALALSDLPDELAADGMEWASAHMLLCPLVGAGGESMGGIAYMRAEPFSEAETAVAHWIAQATGFGMWAWRKDRLQLRRWLGSSSVRLAVAGAVTAFVLLGLVPVQINALAPAEITPMNPVLVTSPLDGVVKEVLVKPNQQVKAGAVVALLEDTAIRNRLAVAEKAYDIARADLQRITYKSFTDEASRMELQVLDARVKEKAVEVAYLRELLGKLSVPAPQGGIAMFTDAEEWRGRPVQIGEQIMKIADPSLIDVTIYLAPEDAVELDVGSEVVLFLNADPLTTIDARITRSSYEAVPGPDGALAYLVRAELLPGHGFPRVGSRGTAKVQGGEVTLAFFLFRKPLAFLRRALGI